MRPANLARRPFRNERIPNVLFVVATLFVLGLTLRPVFLVRALLPRRTSALHDEVQQLEKTSASLRAEQASLRTVTPDPKAVARWVVVKDLVDRRAFSWTALFALLEARLPEGARLVAIAPSLKQGEITLDVQAVVRSPEVGWQFIRALEEGGEFDSVFPLSEGENGEFHYTMRYRPHVVAVADATGVAAATGGSATGQAAPPEAVNPTGQAAPPPIGQEPPRVATVPGGTAVGGAGITARPAAAPPEEGVPAGKATGVGAPPPEVLTVPEVPLTPSGVTPRPRRGRRAEAPA